ncbi:solute carrier family 26 member 6-like [Nematostella vectensis]|uniref:solute carrier family 26 member 6-like n=1 Tax=Nematostella vectensis TaxID=45351 RepID=UPI002076EF98|nr:solute carrier family 26 member 6-like [Nematostella vectensis]
MDLAVLAGVILVALKGLLQQFKRLKELWIICKPDAVVWLVTWSGVVFLGIDTGLAIGIVVALLMVIIRSARPRYQILGQVPGTEIYRDIRQFPGAEEIPGIKIFRFESAVFYANAEYFRNALIQKIGMDPLVVNRHMMGSSQTLNKPSSPQNHEKADSSETVVTFRKKSGDDAVNILPENTVTPSIPNGDAQIENGTDLSDVEPEVKPGKIHTIIIDGSTFNFIDTQGVNTLIKLAKEFQRINVNFYLASCRHSIRDMLDKAHFTRDVGSHHLFISVHDAVIHALMPEQEVLSLASQASLENIDNAQPSLPRPLRSPTNLAYNSTERQKLLANSADQEVFKESSV